MINPLPILAYTGLLFGAVFIHFAKEEYTIGLPYFKNAMKGMFIFGIFLFLISKPNLFAIAIAVLLLLGSFIWKRYEIFAAYLFFIFLSAPYFYVLIFAYGLCAGAVLHKTPQKLFYFAYYPVLAMLVL